MANLNEILTAGEVYQPLRRWGENLANTLYASCAADHDGDPFLGEVVRGVSEMAMKYDQGHLGPRQLVVFPQRLLGYLDQAGRGLFRDEVLVAVGESLDHTYGVRIFEKMIPYYPPRIFVVPGSNRIFYQEEAFWEDRAAANVLKNLGHPRPTVSIELDILDQKQNVDIWPIVLTDRSAGDSLKDAYTRQLRVMLAYAPEEAVEEYIRSWKQISQECAVVSLGGVAFFVKETGGRVSVLGELGHRLNHAASIITMADINRQEVSQCGLSGDEFEELAVADACRGLNMNPEEFLAVGEELKRVFEEFGFSGSEKMRYAYRQGWMMPMIMAAGAEDLLLA